MENEQKLEQVRQTTEQRLLAMQRQNAEKLDECGAWWMKSSSASLRSA